MSNGGCLSYDSRWAGIFIGKQLCHAGEGTGTELAVRALVPALTSATVRVRPNKQRGDSHSRGGEEGPSTSLRNLILRIGHKSINLFTCLVLG